MALGKDLRDELAYALARTDFDAAERDGYRAAWTEDGTRVVVTDVETGEETAYNADDLVRAESDREVNDAREPSV